MAKAVTLKNGNDEEVYPVTDISLVNGNISTGRIEDEAVTSDKIADGAVTQDKIMGGWKLIGEANGSGTNIPLYLDKIYTSGTFKIIASGQCNTEGWADLRAYRGNAIGNATLIKNSWSTISFSGTNSTFAGASDDSGNYIASGTAKAYLQFTLEATSSSHSTTDWRSWNFNFGCGVWGRIGTTREGGAYNKTAFSLTAQYTIYGGHIEVWWHE